MLTKIAEWYRVAEIQPSDETITKRKAAITKLVAHLLSKNDVDLIQECVDVSLFGISETNGASFPHSVVTHIKAEQPSFAESLPDSAMAVRACSIVSLGELISKPDSELALQAASLFLAGYSFRAPTNENHLELALQQLSKQCREQLENAASERRMSSDISSLIASARESSEKEDGIDDTVDALVNAVEQLSFQLANDKEELNVFWWLYRDYSDIKEEQLSSLSPEEICLCAPKEIAELLSLPAPNSVRHVLSRLVAKSKSEISLDKLVAKWSEKSRSAIGSYSDLPSKYPRVFPVAWLCWRWSGKKLPSTWKEEFQEATGLDVNAAKTLKDWSAHIFDEIVALKMVTE